VTKATQGFGIEVFGRKNEQYDYDVGEDGEMETTQLDNLCFADDTALITEKPEDFLIMISDTILAVSQAGLKLSLSKCVWMTTYLMPDQFTMEVFEEVIPRFDSFILLRSKMSANPDPEPALRHRIDKAWGYVYARKDFLKKDAPFRQRMDVWNKTCVKSLLWGLEILTLSKTLITLLENEGIKWSLR